MKASIWATGRAAAFALAAALTGPVAASAATLDLAALGFQRGQTVADFNAVNLFVFDVDPDVGEVFDLDASLAFGPPSGSYLQFVTFDAADPAQAFFSLFVGSDTLSADGASDIGSDDSLDLMQFLFRNVDGDGIFAPFNKGVILVEFSAPQLLPLSDGFFSGGGQLSVTELTRVNIGQVPLPAGLPLLLAGIGAFALLRRRRA